MSLRLSVSKTKTFLQCKKKYDFAYNIKLPRKEFEFHTFGKFCHKVLEDFHNAYLNGSQNAYSLEMSKAWKSALCEFQLTPEMKKDCRAIIDQYLQIISSDKKNNLSANVLACEKNFELNIKDKVVLNGMIDRIQIDTDGLIHVCDYKTSKNKQYQKNDNFQLLTYALVLLKEDPTIERVRGSYIMLRHNFEYLTTEFNKEEILEMENIYEKYADQILKEKEFLPTPTPLCGFCDFLNSCTAGQKKQNYFSGETNYE